MKAPASKAAKADKSVVSGTAVRATKPSATAKTAAAKTAAKKAPAVKKPQAKAPAAAKPVAKPVAKSAAPKPAAKPVAKVPAKAPAKAPAKTSAAATPAAKAASAANALITKVAGSPKAKAKAIVIEPSPPPMGKREARKVMLAQMAQPASVPSHDPDAAKATFSHMNERTVMTPPVPSSLQKDPKRANNWKTLSAEELTDPDVLAMPDTEYMNDKQLAFFRLKLQTLKADMLANAGETTEHLREDTVVVPDPADRATIEEEHALELRTRDRERKLLKKIEQAIARIDSGDYGYCEETGEPIGVGRLMARPTASLSLEAQQRRELKQKMFGD